MVTATGKTLFAKSCSVDSSTKGPFLQASK